MHLDALEGRGTGGAVDDMALDGHLGDVFALERAVDGEEHHVSAVFAVTAAALVLAGAGWQQQGCDGNCNNEE